MTLTPADDLYLNAIFEAAPEDRGRLIRAYYRDLDRAERTPVTTLWFHLGALCGRNETLEREREALVIARQLYRERVGTDANTHECSEWKNKLGKCDVCWREL